MHPGFLDWIEKRAEDESRPFKSRNLARAVLRFHKHPDPGFLDNAETQLMREAKDDGCCKDILETAAEWESFRLSRPAE